MFRKRAGLLICAVVALVMFGRPGEVDAQGFDLQQFHPMPNLQENFFSTSSASVAPHLEWSAFALFNYGRNPLKLRDPETGDRVASLVSDHGTMHLLFSLALWDRLEVGLDVPMIVMQRGTLVPGFADGLADASFGVGDLRIVPKVNLYNTREAAGERGIALALLADVHLPTGDEDTLQGGDFRVGPRLAFDVDFGGPRIAANLGYLYRPDVQLGNLDVNDTLSWNLAAEIPFAQYYRLTGEVFGKVTPSEGFNREESPTELIVGGKYNRGIFHAVAGFGAGLVNGYGTPDWRSFVGLGLAAERVAEPEPEPEPEPECRPETVVQDCPNIPPMECRGGVLRTFGAACSDVGACTYPVVEEYTCPDGMICGVEDGAAACVPAPECSTDSDCVEAPAPTCEDGVLTTWAGVCDAGSCRYVETSEECGEGMRCGEEDGVAVCEPEPIVVTLDEETRRIEIHEMVFFETGSDRIEARSFEVLNQVARIMLDNPQIERVRIEGHTDNVGSRRMNISLSQRRAESVKTYLEGRGVAAERLTAQGFGPDRPIADNATPAGRAENRRVEFYIVD